MNIIDLTPTYQNAFLACLKDWDSVPELDSGRNQKCLWISRMKDKGLRIKLAVNDIEQAIGMIQYLPAEFTRILGEDLIFIQCIWVHGYEEGIGNQQNRGVGSALLHTVEEDAKAMGAKGVAARELAFLDDIPGSWYQKNGYIKVDRLNYDALLWKPFTDSAQTPRLLRPCKVPQPIPGQVTVTAFISHWCPELSDAHLAQQVADEMGECVKFTLIDTTEPDVLHEWGIESALFIDDECINTGLYDYPPPTEDDIRKKIQSHLNTL